MAWGFQPETHAGQPADGADFVFSPLLPPPTFAHIASAPRLDLVSKQFGAHPDSDFYTDGQHGPALAVSRGGDTGLLFPAGVLPLTGDEWTVIILANPGPLAAPGMLLSQRMGSPPYSQVNLTVNSSGGLGASSGSFGVVCANTSGLLFDTTSFLSAVDGAWHVFAATRDGPSAYPVLYVDGKPIATTSGGTPTTTINAAQRTRIGNIADYAAADFAGLGGGSAAFVIAYPAAMPAEPIRKLCSTPQALWQVFADRQVPIWLDIPDDSPATSATTESATTGDASSAVYAAAAVVVESASPGDSASAVLAATASAGESAATGDSASTSSALQAAGDESAATGDAAAALLTAVGAVTESAVTGESAGAVSTAIASAAETATVGDTATAGSAAAGTVDEAAGTGDAAAAMLAALAAAVESATTADSASGVAAAAGTAAAVESVGTGDSATAVLAAVGATAESASTSDAGTASLAVSSAAVEVAATSDASTSVVQYAYSATTIESAATSDAATGTAALLASAVESATTGSQAAAAGTAFAAVVETATPIDLSSAVWYVASDGASDAWTFRVAPRDMRFRVAPRDMRFKVEVP
jgi:hypothetical protein